MRRLVNWYLRRRRVVLTIPAPGLTFHLEIKPDGIVKPVLDDASILDAYAIPQPLRDAWREIKEARDA